MNPKPAGEDSEPRVPTDLRKAFAAAPKAKAQWRDLTPTARRDFISWIDSAKQLETRRRRIERACSMLAAGRRMYSFIFSAAKQSKTRESRVEKCMQQMLNGKGFYLPRICWSNNGGHHILIIQLIYIQRRTWLQYRS
jgi:uncharacterized protein YdeI (YjbR/CyaY-like superfamily)